jgi:tetratricopeptide (TPR) repeat protein
VVRARGILEREHGPDHPRLVRALRDLGECLEARGRSADAEGLYVRVKEILDAAGKITDPYMADTFQKRSRLARRRGEGALADDLLSRSIGVWEKVGNERHLLYARAVAAAHGGNREAALDLLRRALDHRLTRHYVDLEVELAPLRDDPALKALLREFPIPPR